MNLKNIFYKIGCAIGILLLILKFFLYSDKVDFFALGYLILAITFLVNYFFNKGYRDQDKYWWQNVVGFCFIFFSVYYQFDLHKKYELPLTLIAFVTIGIKYVILRLKDNQRKK